MEKSATHDNSGDPAANGTAHLRHVEHMETNNSMHDPADRLPTTPFVIFFAVFIGLSGWLVQFDAGYAGTVLAMETFRSSFGVCNIERDPMTGIEGQVCAFSAIRQSLPAISALFISLGAVFTGSTGAVLGRRSIIQLGCAITAVGAAAMMGTANNYAAFVACKSISGFGLGVIFTSAIPYGVEFVPPRKRGALIALFNLGLAGGLTTVSAVCFGSSQLHNNYAWQTPILCQIPVAVFYGVGLMLFPESPRWLLIAGKDQDARRSLERMYRGHLTPTMTDALLFSAKRNIDLDLELSSTASWTEIFHRRYIMRLLTATLILVFTTLSGTFFVNVYGALFFAEIGISNPFAVNCILAACTLPGAIVGPFVVEKLGRRRCQVIGYSILAVFMLIIGAVNSSLGASDRKSQIILIAFFCLWEVVFTAFITSNSFVFSAEIHTVRLRTYGQAFVVLVTFIFQFGTIFWTPFMISPQYGNMGTNIAYYYMGLSVIFAIVLFFLAPETGQLSLEQIDQYLSSGVHAWSTSLRKNKTIAKQARLELSGDNLTTVSGTGKHLEY